MARDDAIIALDLGGTKLAAALFSARGRLLQKTLVLLEGREGRAVGKLVTAQLEHLAQVSRNRRLRLKAVGVAVPGISRRNGTVWAPNISGWTSYPLRRELESALARLPGRARVRVVIEGDRACYILGEKWRGVAGNCPNAIFLAVGTGIGAGILADGRVLRGADDIAGAAGWMALEPPFKRQYTRCGCMEYYASGPGLVRLARNSNSRSTTSALPGTKKSFGLPEIFEAYKRGAAPGRVVIGRALQYWGMAVANLTSLFNPEMIVLGGGVFGPARKFTRQILAEAKKWAQPLAIKRLKLTVSKLGPDAGLYGAAFVALSALDKPPNRRR